MLGGRSLGSHDNFFKNGGHSLLAVRLLNRIRREFGQDLTLRDVFRNPTAASLARRLAATAAEPADPAPADPTGRAPKAPEPPRITVPAPSRPVPPTPALKRRTRAGSRQGR
ncbi:phosphopantetheine-binding protein [Streptomyces showdoensis]|uniref:phosphopantetheine-binding protein n=1 Tax=Streptomyces showdoensis TaxID=68268 RepID=UPI00337D3910